MESSTIGLDLSVMSVELPGVPQLKHMSHKLIILVEFHEILQSSGMGIRQKSDSHVYSHWHQSHTYSIIMV